MLFLHFDLHACYQYKHYLFWDMIVLVLWQRYLHMSGFFRRFTVSYMGGHSRFRSMPGYTSSHAIEVLKTMACEGTNRGIHETDQEGPGVTRNAHH